MPRVMPERRRRVLRRWLPTVVVTLACIWLILQTGKIILGVVNPDMDYRAAIRELVSSRQARQGENGWPLYQEAFQTASRIGREHLAELAEQSRQDGGEFLYCDYGRILFGPNDPARWRIELDQLQRLKKSGVFELLERAAAVERAVGEPPHPDPEFGNVMVFGTLDIELSSARSLGDALACRMRLALLEQDWETHARTFDAALASARALGTQGVAVQNQVALRMLVTVLDELQYGLAERPMSSDHLQRLAGSLAGRSKWLTDYTLVVEVDRLAMLDALQHWYTDHGFGIGFVALTRLPAAGSSSISGMSEVSPTEKPSLLDRFSNLRALTLPSRGETRSDIEDWTQAILEACAAKPHLWLDEFARVERAFQPRLNANEQFALMIPYQHSKVLEKTCETMRRARVVQLTLAIEHYRTSHGGASPATLDEVADIGDFELRIDPVTGTAIGYTVTSAIASHEAGVRRPYLLFVSNPEGGEGELTVLNDLRPESH